MGRPVAFATKRAKYGSVPTVVDGIRFASAREAHRYGELQLLARAGLIRGLTLQPVFELVVPSPVPGALPIRIGSYRADFAYETPDGRKVYEDVKGVRTALYVWKKRHVEAQYGVCIVEV